MKFRRSEINIWPCHLLLFDSYYHSSASFGNPCSTDTVFFILHSTVVASIPALRLRALEGKGTYGDGWNPTDTQFVSSTDQHFYKLLCPCLQEGKSTLWWVKRVMSCAVVKISLSMLHMWMINGFPYFYLYLK